mgnify:CR=1 FL=1|jgi:hypothetical protein
MEPIKLQDIDILKDFITSNVPLNINEIEIIFGNKINNMMFNTRFNLISKNNYDIIPIINSIFSIYFNDDKYKLSIKNVANNYYDNNCYSIIQNYGTKNKQSLFFIQEIINYNLIDNICMKSKNINYKPNIYSNNMKTYNHKETFVLLEWKCSNDIYIIIKFYKTYFTFEMKIIINENNKIPPNKMKLIQEIYKKMVIIYKNVINIK